MNNKQKYMSMVHDLMKPARLRAKLKVSRISDIKKACAAIGLMNNPQSIEEVSALIIRVENIMSIADEITKEDTKNINSSVRQFRGSFF